MAARPGQGPIMEQFEAYFQRADLDRDGRISGAEAVAFFQGSNLPNQILAQIWMHSDRRNTGFLGRAEFYIALRLVAVAQSGQQLTKEIIKAALEGTNAVKIPPPQINPMVTSTPVNPTSASMPSLNRMPSPAQMGTVPTTPSQSVGSNGPQVFPNGSMNQQFSSNITRPIQATVALSLFPMQPVSGGLPGGNSVASSHNQNLNAPNLAANWLVGRTAQASDASIPSRGVTGLANQNGFEQSFPMATASAKSGPQETSFLSASLPPKPVRSLSSSLQPADNNALVVSGNGFSSGSVSGVDAFSVTQPKQDASFSVLSASRIPSTSNTAATMIGYQPSQSVQVISPANMPTTLAGGGMLQNSQSLVKQNQQGAIPSISGSTSTVGIGTLEFSLAQSQWPKMTRSNIQKYTKVFVEVDKDRDGKITGEEARNLFLSWRLPREVLKQVWDLSDQDGDSMLSLREFCIALYLMERYREGRPLPTLLPSSLVYDEALLQVTNQPSARQGFPQQGMPGTPQQGFHVMPAAELKPHQQVQRSPQVDGKVQPVQQKSGVPILEKRLINQLSNEEQNALSSKLKEATNAEKKVQELEKEILESNQKIEFYRTKMQELVIYKSRCDNRFNEITERASTDKREVEALTKKYEEKCKEVGDVASKLTAEEATFHDIQGKKLELFNAIVKMNNGEKDNSVFQVRADSIQSDLDELVKGLNARCKKYGLRVKPTTLVELPFGWQPGIQESAADWDEDWDKFEDEVSGFVLIKELTVDVENIIAPPKSKAPSVSNYQASNEETSPIPYSDVHKTLVDTSNIGSQVVESELSHAHSENGSVRSLPGTPSGGAALGSPSHHISSPKYEINDIKDNHSDHGATDSTIFGKTYADDQLWGTNFDTDTDSIWGFDPMNKATGDESNNQNSFFGYEDFGLNPIRTGSPSAASVSGMDRPFFDSVPSTPSGYSGFSPRYGEGQDQSYGFGHFDSLSSQGNFLRFDSINSSSRDFDRADFFTQHNTYARFDSISSSRDSDHGRGFPSIDDADPFGSRLFKSSENHTPRGSDNWSSF